MDAAREATYNQNKFLAALKGISLEDNAAEGRVEAIKRRMAAEAAGVSEEVYELDGIFGFEVEDEEEE